MSHSSRVALLIGLFVILLLAGVYAFTRVYNSGSVADVPQASPTPTEEAFPMYADSAYAGWSEYRSAENKLVLRHPITWTLNDKAEGLLVTLSSPSFTKYKESDPEAGGIVPVKLKVYASAVDLPVYGEKDPNVTTLKKYLESELAKKDEYDIPQGQVASYVAKKYGEQTIYLVQEPNNELEELYYLEVDGKVYELRSALVAEDEKEDLQKILSSLRFE